MKNDQVAKTLEDFISAIKKVIGGMAPSKAMFFRGVANSQLEVLPSVLRRDFAESDLAHQFRARASVLSGAPNHDDLDSYLFLMQHHGLPTRLLDWTESPLIALHFALHEEHEGKDAAVYVLDPTRLNKPTLGNKWFPDRRDHNYRYRFLKAFYRTPEKLPWDTGVDYSTLGDKNLPLAIRPIITHQRMVSQQAAFTIQGDDTKSLHQIIAADNSGELENTICKISIPAARKSSMKYDLIKCGISRSVIFPDLDGIAIDLTSKSLVELKRLSKHRVQEP